MGGTEEFVNVHVKVHVIRSPTVVGVSMTSVNMELGRGV